MARRVDTTADTIYLCEGETDAITLIDNGIEDDGSTAVVGLQGATFNVEPWSFLFTDKDVIIASDYDKAGRKSAGNIKRSLSWIASSIKYLRLDKEPLSQQAQSASVINYHTEVLHV
jgi:DNA primase